MNPWFCKGCGRNAPELKRDASGEAKCPACLAQPVAPAASSIEPWMEQEARYEREMAATAREEAARAAFRAYDGPKGRARNQTPWQIWRDAVEWANRQELIGGDTRRHVICICPDCTKPL